jgi:DNA-binding MarR family transcriptional regulator
MNNDKKDDEQLQAAEAYRVWVLLAQAREAIYDYRQQELLPYNISPKHAAVLHSIRDIGGEVTPTKIARWLGRKPHSILGILGRMEKRGYVKRTKDMERKNIVRVVVTDKGDEAYNKSLKREAIIKAFSALSDEERQQLASCLEKIRNKAIDGMPDGYSLYFQQFK